MVATSKALKGPNKEIILLYWKYNFSLVRYIAYMWMVQKNFLTCLGYQIKEHAINHNNI